MSLYRIHGAILEWCELRVLRANNDDVIVSITKKGQPQGFGKGQGIVEALQFAERDLEQEGLFGIQEAECACQHNSLLAVDVARPLDEFLSSKGDILVWRVNEQVVVRLTVKRPVLVPAGILSEVINTGESRVWKFGSNRYETAPDPQRSTAGGVTSTVTGRPKFAKDVKGGVTCDDWNYYAVRTGSGVDLWTAFKAALAAAEEPYSIY